MDAGAGAPAAVTATLRARDHLPDRFNAARWFVGRHVEEGRGGRTALITDAGETSYAELDRAVRGFGKALREAGLHPGDRTALILPDGPAFAAAFWGTLAAGGVAVPLNTLLTPDDHRAVLDDCDPRFVVRDPRLAEAGTVEGPGRVVWNDDEVDGLAGAPLDGYASTHRDGFAFILYSSGTTGQPKGVVHLHHDMWVSSETYAEEVLHVGPDDRAFSVAKLFFAYGLGNALYFPLHVGGSAVLFPGRPTPEAVFDQVSRHRPTLFYGVPTSYAQMLDAMERGVEADFSSVRLCVSAGEALPAPLFRRWLDATGIEILDGIGSTEICHIFLSNRPGEVRPGSSGVPVPGYRVRVVDEGGADADPGAVGDLLVRGDSTMALYWNRHEETKETLAGPWIRTGDKYRRDGDGYFWHAGRSDDMLKVSGQWVSPVEIESTILEHEAVLECAVAGEEDAEGLVKPRAWVVLRDGVDPAGLAEILREHVRARLAAHKYPRRVTFVDALPKTATGKIRRYVLRERARGGEDGEGGGSP